MDWLVKFFREGGALMFVNLGVLVFVLALILERFFILFFRLPVNTRLFMAEVDKQLKASNFEKAKRLCADNADRVLPRVLLAALNAMRYGGEFVARSIDEAKAEVTPKITKRTNLLWPIANIATLVGLVGTVIGLIQAFAAVGVVSAEQKAQLLTKGIAHAMNNTAFGLTIALIATMAHMILSNQTRRLSEDVEMATLHIENLLSRIQAERTQRPSDGQQAS